MTDQTMPQPSGEIRRINWAACFPFTMVFKTFRMAMQPSKLGLALAAVVLTSAWGVLLDGLWRSKHQPPAGEVNAFWQQANIDAWRDSAKASWSQSLHSICDPLKIKLREKLDDHLKTSPHSTFQEVLDKIAGEHATAIQAARDQLQKNSASQEQLDAEIARRSLPYVKAHEQVRAMAPRGVYVSFIEYERLVVRQLIKAATSLNFTEGFSEVLTTRTGQPPATMSAMLGGLGVEPGGRPRGAMNSPAEALVRRLAQATHPASMSGPGLDGPGSGANGWGVVPCVVLAVRGLQWMVYEHIWFAVLFWLPVLVIWGWFGGAICRMSAMGVARDERLSPGVAMQFAQRKLLSLATAPLFPVGFVFVIGVVLALGGLFTAIPGVGELLGGLGMALGIAAGLLMGAVLIGGLAGFPLMWPTIVTEGSDAFDAFGRSYSFVFNRPWRAAFYAAVLTVYGAICYLVVRLFVLVGLKAARFFIGVGLAGTTRAGTGREGATKLDVLWPAPTWDQLLPDRIALGTQAWDAGGQFLIGLWLTIVMGLLCAFAVSFFLSGSTIIYFLLRREVDATDIEEVYIDSDEEESPLDLPVAAGEPGIAPPPSGAGGGPGASPGGAGGESAPGTPPGPGNGNIDAE